MCRRWLRSGPEGWGRRTSGESRAEWCCPGLHSPLDGEEEERQRDGEERKRGGEEKGMGRRRERREEEKRDKGMGRRKRDKRETKGH